MATELGTSTVRPPRKKPGSQLKLRNTLVGWSFILPNFLGFALLTMIPVITLFYYGFTDWSILGTAEFNGIANFRKLAGDPNFRTALFNTFYYAIFHIPLTFAASLGLAILLNRKLRGLAFFRSVAFFPYITSIVAIAAVWNALFSPEYGPINAFLNFIGIADPPGWTVDGTWAMPAIIIVATWREMGYYMLLLLAGLQTIPREYYEAAKVDGANSWQQFAHITMPSLRPTTFFVVVMLTIESFKVFDLILVMTNGGPGTSTLVLSQFIYRKAFEENQAGYASSAAIVLFLICLGVTIIQFLYNKRKES